MAFPKETRYQATYAFTPGASSCADAACARSLSLVVSADNHDEPETDARRRTASAVLFQHPGEMV